jgi:RNA polymerase sigma-70 factor (ECF subfamily)
MSSSNLYDTRVSLILSLKNGCRQEQVWPDFADKYGPLIYRWCLRWGANPQDAEDIVQQTLLSVFLKIEMFESRHGQGSFRGWIRRIARNVWLKIVSKSIRMNRPVAPGSQSLGNSRLLWSSAARDDLLNHFDALACEEIRDLAFDKVRQRIRPQTWEAYYLSDHDNLPGQDVAERLGMSLKAVHLAAIRVRRMLSEELADIDPYWHSKPGFEGD